MNKLEYTVMRWFEWRAALDSDGYPSNYDLSTIRSDTLPGNVVPLHADIPKDLKEINTMMREMEFRRPKHFTALKTRHACGGTSNDKAKLAGMTLGSWRRQVDLAFAWLDGRSSRP